MDATVLSFTETSLSTEVNKFESFLGSRYQVISHSDLGFGKLGGVLKASLSCCGL